MNYENSNDGPLVGNAEPGDHLMSIIETSNLVPYNSGTTTHLEVE